MSNPEFQHEDQAIAVSWVSREDLVACRPDLADQIATMSAAEFARIADQVSDALQETYHLAVFTVLNVQFGQE